MGNFIKSFGKVLDSCVDHAFAYYRASLSFMVGISLVSVDLLVRNHVDNL